MKDHNLNFKAAAPKGGGFFCGVESKNIGQKCGNWEKKRIFARYV